MTAFDLATQAWHDVSGQTGSLLIAAVEQLIEKERAEMAKEPKLTAVEARVLWTHITAMACPRAGYPEWVSALKKLCQMGGGYSCRDCTNLGTKASRYGGFVCAEHKAEENARFGVDGPAGGLHAPKPPTP